MSDRLVEIHINMQGRVIVRYEGGKCVDVTDTRGRKLYSAQAQAGDGEAVYAYRRKGLDYFCTCDESRYLELSEKSSFEVAIFYTAPPAEVNQQLLEALKEIAEWTERYTSPGHPVSAVARKAIAAAQEKGK